MQTNHITKLLTTSVAKSVPQLILLPGIRGQCSIENRLHWGSSAVGGFPDLRRLPFKDVIFDEDHSTIRMGNAPANLSVMRTMPSGASAARTAKLLFETLRER